MNTKMFSLEHRTAMITGASRGLGQYFAKALASAGASLIITSRHQEDLIDFADELRQAGVNIYTLSLDVTDSKSIEQCYEQIIKDKLSVDILVNNAGCNVRKPALEITEQDWDKIINTNLKGSFFVSQKIAPIMIQRKYGRIINIGSVTANFGYAGLTPYCASRGGVKQMTMSLADEWGIHGITVNCLAPGWFHTKQNAVLYENNEWLEYIRDRIPLKREGYPHDLDGAIVFLASEESRYITGQTLFIDGGITTGATKATV